MVNSPTAETTSIAEPSRSMSATPVLTLLTDFGLQDTYVAQMHGVIAGIAPAARVIDLTHAIEPQNVMQGAVALVDAVAAFPDGTFHVVIVDPGVGSDRRAIAAEIGPWRFVGPDNGVFTGVLDRWPLHRAVSLTNPQFFRPEVSRTFHGRDIFVPVAAHWANGTPLESFGELVTDPLKRIDWPRPTVSPGQIEGEVMVVDHFGNLITNIQAMHLPAGQTVEVQTQPFIIGPIVDCYADQPGRLMALIGSSGRLEIARGNHSAAQTLQLGVGAKVRVNW